MGQEGSDTLILQIRANIATEEDIMEPSFKVAARLDERAADLAGRELLRFSRRPSPAKKAVS